jgi:hypothetical protein
MGLVLGTRRATVVFSALLALRHQEVNRDE